MFKWAIRAAALSAALVIPVGLACASDVSCDSYSPSCDYGCDYCDTDCSMCRCSAWIFDAEATLFRYHRADGVQNINNPIQFDFFAAPRLMVGYQNSGRGVRFRYWEYDQRAENAGDSIDVSTYTLDAEWFTTLFMDSDTQLEFSAGVRYVDYLEVLDFPTGVPVTEETAVDGAGGLLGLQVNQALCYGEVFARARGSIIMTDKNTSTPPTLLVDATQTITEVTVGYQFGHRLWNDSLLLTRVAGEWQQWSDFSVDQNLGGDTASDVGFFGVVLGGGLHY